MCHHVAVRSTDSEVALRRFAVEHGVNLDEVDGETLARTMVDWYRAERADDVDVDADGDMLLFQWGRYDWGEGEWFEFDVTRQFIVVDLEDDDAFFQLSWKLLFQPSALSAQVGEGNRWCMHPDEADEFLSFILGGAVIEGISRLTLVRRQLQYSAAG